MEIAEVLEQHLQEFELPEAEQLQEVDAGAEEELFRRMGQQVVCQKLGQRWQAADQTKEAHCSQCKQKMKALGRRPKRIHSLCGPINYARLTDQWALEHHLPVGSGNVESAERHIVQLRFKQSGMRWSDQGARDILHLRTLHRSGHFEQYWEDYAASGF